MMPFLLSKRSSFPHRRSARGQLNNKYPKQVKSEIFLFADDTKIFREIKNNDDCKLLQEDLNCMVKWTSDWLLKFHPDKCKTLEVTRKAPRNYMYMIEGTELDHVEEEKDIGVITDQKLTFSNHMVAKINTANNIMGLITWVLVLITFKSLDEEMFKKLYKSLVRPHLEYATAVWNPYLEKDITAIENVQRRATKLIPGLKDMSYEDRQKILKLPTLKYRRLRGEAIKAFKILNGVYDKAVATILPLHRDNVANPTRTRGDKTKLYQTRYRLNLRKNFFTIKIVKIWNSLPPNVTSSPNVKTFERRLDKHWMKQPIIYDHKANLSIKKGSHRDRNKLDEEDMCIEALFA